MSRMKSKWVEWKVDERVNKWVEWRVNERVKWRVNEQVNERVNKWVEWRVVLNQLNQLVADLCSM